MQGSYWGMALYILWEYLAGASYHSYAPLFFSYKGFSAGQITLLSGIGPLMAVLLQPLWGTLSDRLPYKNSVHFLLLLGAAFTLPLYIPMHGLPAMLGIASLSGGFSTSVTPLGEAILLEHLEREGKKFGPLRVWGTVSFAVGAQAMGLLLERHLERFPWAVTSTYVVAAVASLLLPRVAGHEYKRSTAGWQPLLRRPALLLLLVLVACLQLTQGLYYSLFPLHFTQALGGGHIALGAAALVAAAAEIPFLLLGDRLFARFGVRRLTLSAGVVMAVRWVLLGMLHSISWVLAVQVLNGFGLIVPTFCVVKHIQKTVPAQLKARGQMLASLITFGLGRGLMMPVGWGLSKIFAHITPVFYIMSGVCIAAVLCLGLPLLRMGEEGAA